MMNNPYMSHKNEDDSNDVSGSSAYDEESVNTDDDGETYSRAAFTPPSFSFGMEDPSEESGTSSSHPDAEDREAEVHEAEAKAAPDDEAEVEIIPIEEDEVPMGDFDDYNEDGYHKGEEQQPTEDDQEMGQEQTDRVEQPAEDPKLAFKDESDSEPPPPALVPTPPEVEPEDRDMRTTDEHFANQQLETARRRIRYLFMHIICLWVIILIFIILLAVFGTRDDTTTRAIVPPTPAPKIASDAPTSAPSTAPSELEETAAPTNAPTDAPTQAPVAATLEPTPLDTSAPSTVPSAAPTRAPVSLAPSMPAPTDAPSTSFPTLPPNTAAPTIVPQQCFQTREELELGIERWFMGDPGDNLKETYGWPIGNWCMEGITNFNSLFAEDRIGDQAVSFNEDLSGWDLSAATDMGSMFDGARSFNKDLTTWDVSQNQNLTRTFARARNFNGDISTWQTGSVTEMRGTFFLATSFNRDISGWDVRNVITMRAAFLQAEKFNQDISAWRPDKAVSLNSMFFGATNFEKDLCDWGVSFRGRGGDSTDMFLGTSCPMADAVTHLRAPIAGPLCHVCDDLFDLICELLSDCGVLYDDSKPQTQAFDWLRNTNTAILTNTKKIQRYALATLYYSADGDNWFDNDFWLTPIDECLWHSSESPSCDVNRDLVSLSLDNNGLFGELPLDISLLTSLRIMNLKNNTLFGTIPRELGTMTNLEQLQLNKNFFIGQVPKELGNLVNLELLRLDGNDMSGTLPEEICNLVSPEIDTTIFLDCVDVPSTCEADFNCCTNEEPCPG